MDSNLTLNKFNLSEVEVERLLDIALIPYTIRPGDTIYKLAEQFHTSIPAILSVNPGLYHYDLLVGQQVMIPIESGDPVQSQQNFVPSMISANELNLRNTLRKLWEEHVEWTRMAILSAASDSPDLNLVVNRLLRNATDMAAVLSPLYGDVNASRFGSLIREHLKIALQLVNAAKEGNSQVTQNTEKQWYENADQIADYLNMINPYISKDDFRKMLYMHLALTKAEAVARLNHNYATDIALYDQIENQALSMADTMANGIVKQFPNLFY